MDLGLELVLYYCWPWPLRFIFWIFQVFAYLALCSFVTHLGKCFSLWLRAVWLEEFFPGSDLLPASLLIFSTKNSCFLKGWKYYFCSNRILFFICWYLSWVSRHFIFWSFWEAMEPNWPIFVVRFQEKRWFRALIRHRFLLLLLCCIFLTFGRTGWFFRLKVSFWG